MKTCTENAQKGPIKTLTKRSFLLNLILTGGVALAASGCSSLANIGESEYSCQSENGVKCKSTLEVYELTHGGNIPEVEPKEEKTKRAPSGKKVTEKTSDAKDKEGSEEAETKKTEDKVVDTYVAPRLPDRPVPIRTPAHVMRIWFAPWEDTNGDLNTTGYMYTEVEERRWVIGKGDFDSQSTLRPLQTIQSENN